MSTPQSTFFVNRFTLLGTTVQEYIIDLEKFNLEGFFSLQGMGLTAGLLGTCTVTYQVSNNGIDYVTPTGATAIITAQSNSAKFGSFSPPQCRYLKLIFTPTNNITADFWLSMS